MQHFPWCDLQSTGGAGWKDVSQGENKSATAKNIRSLYCRTSESLICKKCIGNLQKCVCVSVCAEGILCAVFQA